MNQEQARRLLPIVQAIADGKTVQWRETGANWEDARSIDFADDMIRAQEFRVKPETHNVYVASWFVSGAKVVSVSYTSETYEQYLRTHFGDMSGFRVDVIERELP